MKYLVCVHAGPEIGKRGSLAAALDLAEQEAAKRSKQCNVYPIQEGGRLGLRVASISPERKQ